MCSIRADVAKWGAATPAHSRSVVSDDGAVGAIPLISMAVAAGYAPTGCDAGTEGAASAVIAMTSPKMPVMDGPSVVVLAKGFGYPGPKMPDPGPCVDQSILVLM